MFDETKGWHWEEEAQPILTDIMWDGKENDVYDTDEEEGQENEQEPEEETSPTPTDPQQ